MNVVMFTSDYLPNIGGIAAHVHFVSRALSAGGHRVVVVRPRPSHRTCVEFDEIDGVPVCNADYKANMGRLGRARQRVLATRGALASVRERLGRIDVVHQHDYVSSAVSLRLAGLRCPWVWTNHSSTFLAEHRRPIRRLVLRLAFGRIDALVAVSRELDLASRALWGSRVSYIPNGVDAQRFSPEVTASRADWGVGESDFVVLCPRRAVPKNGVIYLARAAKRLVCEQPQVPWQFLFLGTDPAENTDSGYVNEVRDALAQAMDKGRAKCLGNIPLAEMPALNRLADVVAIPSLVEAVSLSALEAMAVARPVVATNVGGLPEIVHDRDTGLLVEPRDPDALASALIELAADDGLRTSLGASGRALVEGQYRWDCIAVRLAALYDSLVSARARRPI